VPSASRISPAQAEEIGRRYYGIDAVAARLPAEVDDTFRLTTPDGTHRLLKVSVLEADPADPAGRGAGGAPADRVGAQRDGTGLQTAVLLHLAATARELPVQRVIATPDGRSEVRLDGEAARLVRLTSWLDGQPVQAALASTGAGTGGDGSVLRHHIGGTLARLNIALRGFSHPDANRTHRWDLQNFHQLRPLLDELGDIEERAALFDCLRRFDEVLRPRLAEARRQVVHTDFHGDNLLTDGTRVTGILDFGDALTGPVAMDVGVAACYQLGCDPATDDPLRPALDVIAGYHAVDPLTPADLPLIGEFIVLRLAARLIVSRWNAAREPGNGDYLLRRTPQAARLFGLLRATRAEVIQDRLRAALESAA
jgi:hydroxylysine kinase